MSFSETTELYPTTTKNLRRFYRYFIIYLFHSQYQGATFMYYTIIGSLPSVLSYNLSVVSQNEITYVFKILGIFMSIFKGTD